MAKKFEIRNSTAEFLMFVSDDKEEGVQVVYKDETVWATQKAMAELFDVGVAAISKHLKNIFDMPKRSLRSIAWSRIDCLVRTLINCCRWTLMESDTINNNLE